MSWEKVKLEDLYDVHNGLSKGGKFFGSGYPFITFSTVFNNFFLPDEITDYVQSTEKEQAAYSVLRGDVFVTRTSETSDELGMSCVALKDYPRATYNGFTKRMRPKDNSQVYPEYIGYYMRMPSFRAEFQAFSTMTTRASLRNEDLLSLYVNLPPYQEQVRIAETLRNYDLLIKNNQKQIKLLEEAAQRLYKEWFVDLRFPGHETTPITDGLPKGWSVHKIGEHFDTYLGGTPSRAQPQYWQDGTIPWINSGKANELRVVEPSEYITELALKKSATKMLPIHTTLVAITGATLGQVSYTEIETCANQSVVGIVDPSGHFEEYIYCYVSSNIKRIISKATGGAQQHINKDIVNAFDILLPSDSVAVCFKNHITPLFEKIKDLLFQNILLAEARDRLLPKLMNGEIEV